MDEYRILRRTALLFGLRREDVRCIAQGSEGGCNHAIALLLPGECGDTAQQLAAAMNDVLNIEAGLGNGALLDLWGGRHVRFAKEAKWYEKLMASYFPEWIDKRYAGLTRELAFVEPGGEGQCAVVVATGERAEAILDVLETHEEELRTIIRKAVPSHHLLAAPVKKETPAADAPYVHKKPMVPKFIFTPVFAEGAPASMKINV